MSPIREGSWWTNGEHDVQVTRVTKKDVYYTCSDAVGACEVWHFRKNFAPVKREEKAAPLPVCVHHRDGWCIRKDQRKTGYADSVETKCGHFVTMPYGVERHQPTCTECAIEEKGAKAAITELSK